MARTQIDKSLIPSIGTLSSYRRPTLVWASVTQVNIDDVVITNQPQVLFPDGELRSETSTTLYNFVITRNAVLTGTKQSGLRTSLSEATNTWYAIYAVKAQDSSGFVAVGDTVFPVRGNITTLNTNFGTNGWVYLGMIRNGDNGGSTGDILNFIQAGNTTLFQNIFSSASSVIGWSYTGTKLASTASAANLTYTYTAGSGTTDIPSHLPIVKITAGISADTALMTIGTNVNDRRIYAHNDAVFQGQVCNVWTPIQNGITVGNQSSRPYEIFCSGFVDIVLGVGPNPLV